MKNLKLSIVCIILFCSSIYANEITVNSKKFDLPDSFTKIYYLDKPFRVNAHDMTNGAFLMIRTDHPESLELHVNTLRKPIKSWGGNIVQIDCEPACTAYYTEYTPRVKEHTKYMYFIKTAESYYQIDYEGTKPEKDKELVNKLFNWLKTPE